MEKVSNAIEVVLAATDFWRCVLNCAKLFSETNSEKKTNHLKIPGIDAKVLTFKESSYFVRLLYKTCGGAINSDPPQKNYLIIRIYFPFNQASRIVFLLSSDAA